MKILVVDDEPGIRKYLEEVLTELGHAVVTVPNGYDAVDYVREHDVNLAYIDVAMPGIDGFETLKKIREIDPKVPAVMISGNAVERMLNAPLKEGVYVCLRKPFTIEDIEEINKSFEVIKGPLEFIYENPHDLDTRKLYGANILVADDEKEILNMINECLNEEGFTHVDNAGDGEQAITKFNKKKHDLVIIDIVMPKMSGMEVLRHVKAVSANSQVVIITANASKDTAITAVKLGAYDYIEKPFELDALARIAKRAIEKKLLLDERE
jgi:DNA-binding NtrC family response regulator